MSKSKIAIVIAPSIYTWERFTAIQNVIAAVADADGIALVIPSENKFDGIPTIIGLVDGVVVIAAEENGHEEDSYARELGRAVMERGINSLRIIGNRSFIASDDEMKEWGQEISGENQTIPLDEIEQIREMMERYVPSAGTVSAFRRLARPQYGRNLEKPIEYLASPVTNG